MKPKPVEYHPAAQREFEEDADWYEDREPGLGERFQQAVIATEHFIQRHPELGTPHRRKTRKRGVKTFPYIIIYREEAERIVVFAVAHGKRRPGYWLRRAS